MLYMKIIITVQKNLCNQNILSITYSYLRTYQIKIQPSVSKILCKILPNINKKCKINTTITLQLGRMKRNKCSTMTALRRFIILVEEFTCTLAYFHSSKVINFCCTVFLEDKLN